MNNKGLQMTFDPGTIQHLGLKMYSQAPAAIAELVANAYDADASKVDVKLYNGETKKIVVSDDGMGMSFDEINDKFLKIGRNRREGSHNAKTPKGRFPSGKKGLGKLALFGLGDVITIQTNSDNKCTKFVLDWNDIKSAKKIYEPRHKSTSSTKKGTTITISKLKRSSPFKQNDIASSLIKLFHYADKDFLVYVGVDDNEPAQLNTELKFSSIDIQFEWSISETDATKQKIIVGKIVTAPKPLKPGLRGITLYANGRLVNLPEFFGRVDSSHFFSYATGMLEVDYIDQEHGENDLIATNRQSLNWEHPKTQELKERLKAIVSKTQIEWRKKRSKETQKDTNFDTTKWLKTLPEDKAEKIQFLLTSDVEDNDTLSVPNVLKTLHEIAPEYAEFHWRYLSKHIKNNQTVKRLYQQGNYYQASHEAIRLYISKVKKLAKITQHSDLNIIRDAFSEKNKIRNIQLTEMSNPTECNIEEGNASFARGLIQGFRNPMAHKLEEELKRKKLITEQDCLDILSLISHLFSRLERRVSPKPKKKRPNKK